MRFRPNAEPETQACQLAELKSLKSISFSLKEIVFKYK